MLWGKDAPVSIVDIEEKFIQYRYNNYQYRLWANSDYFSKTKEKNLIFLHPGKEA